MKHYLVGTGIVLLHQDADSPRQAIELVKAAIRARGEETWRQHPTIGMSLVEALNKLDGWLAAGGVGEPPLHSSNFVVFDTDADGRRNNLVAGELNGAYEEPVTRKLATLMRQIIPDAQFYTTDYRTA